MKNPKFSEIIKIEKNNLSYKFNLRDKTTIENEIDNCEKFIDPLTGKGIGIIDRGLVIRDDGTITDILVNSAVLQKLSASNSRILLDKRLSCIQDYAESIANYAGKTLKTPISALNLGAFFNDTSLEPTSNMIAGKDYCAPTAKILVVDDNAVNLKIFSSLCEPHDFMIDCVETGEDCVTRTESEKYDVVFLDHMMPGKDGIDTIREIHSNESNPNRETPFVAFTANAVSGMKEMFLSEMKACTPKVSKAFEAVENGKKPLLKTRLVRLDKPLFFVLFGTLKSKNGQNRAFLVF